MRGTVIFLRTAVNSAVRINQITPRTVDLAVHLIVENHHLIRIERECYILHDAIFLAKFRNGPDVWCIIRFHLRLNTVWSNLNDRC